MAVSLCCCLGCRCWCRCRCRCRTRVAPEGLQHSRASSGRSRDQQALEFLSVCAEAAKQGQVDTATQRAASGMVHFLKRIVMLGVVCPTLYFCGLLPLLFDSLPAWCWGSYYWTYTLVGVSFFAQSNMTACCGAAPHWGASLCVLTTMIIVAACLASAEITSTGGWLGALVAQVFCVCVCVYWPSIHGVLRCAWRNDTFLKESLAYLAGMIFGVVPCVVATAAYVLVLHYNWADDVRLVIVLLVIWCTLPILMKLAGKHLFVRGSPASPALAPVLWIYYIEAIFALLGLGLFNNATGSAMAYACSLAVMLVLQVARGTRVGYRCLPCMGSLSLHRLIIFFEMFAALTGRVAGYTLFLCFGILKLARGVEQERTLVVFTDGLHPGKINLYAHQVIGIASILTGVLGFTIVVSIFTACSYLLPIAWPCEAAGQNRDFKAAGESFSEVVQHEAGSQQGAESAGQSPVIDVQESVRVNGSSWIQEAGHVPTRTMQYHLLLSFMTEYSLLLVSTLVFNIGMCIYLVDLASAVIAVLQRGGNL